MSKIIVADLHLTSNRLDEYRWEWLDAFTELSFNKNSELVILGDLTEEKDRHKETLVNRLTSYLRKWSTAFSTVTLLAGNHDGLTSSKPFFQFLDLLPNVKFITEPVILNQSLYLPHSREPISEWKNLIHKKGLDYIFMHQAIEQASTSSGFKLSSASLPPDYFNDCKATIIAGDIHVPQTINSVIYVGAPYHVYYGDAYKGRFMLIKDKVITYQSIKSLSKWKIKIDDLDNIKNYKIEDNDQVSIEYTIDRSDQHRWVEIRDKLRNIVKSKKAALTSLELIVNKNEASIDYERSKVKTSSKMSDWELIKIFADLNKLNQAYYDTAIKIASEAQNAGA